MQTGAFISGWGHLIVIGVAALSGPIFQDETENSISVSEISVVSLSEFDILQKKFSKDENYSNSLIDIKKEEDQLEKLDENTSNKDENEIIDKEKLASEIIKTSTPSIDSPELPEIVNSTPSGFDTMVTVVGKEVALNLDVPKAASLQSPDENFDVKIDTIPLPTPVEDLENGKNMSIIEVNGALSEPAHIYDPKYSFFRGVSEIIRHHKIMYEISIENKRRDPSKTTFISVMKELNTHFKEVAKLRG